MIRCHHINFIFRFYIKYENYCAYFETTNLNTFVYSIPFLESIVYKNKCYEFYYVEIRNTTLQREDFLRYTTNLSWLCPTMIEMMSNISANFTYILRLTSRARKQYIVLTILLVLWYWYCIVLLKLS